MAEPDPAGDGVLDPAPDTWKWKRTSTCAPTITVSSTMVEDRPQGLVTGASGDRDLEEVVAAAIVRCFRLWQQRQRKYGRGNISRHGALGCLIRDTDKTARLERYYLEGKRDEMVDETVVDTWMDKVNYALMGLICFEKHWPGSPEAK